jgi:hypothetical protein
MKIRKLAQACIGKGVEVQFGHAFDHDLVVPRPRGPHPIVAPRQSPESIAVPGSRPLECHRCGFTPAAPIKTTRISADILSWRRMTSIQPACRVCAQSAVREAQAHNLVAGWWGLLIAPLLTLWFIGANAGAHRKHQQAVGVPQHRRPDSQAPASSPVTVKPVSLRPLAILTPAVLTALSALAVLLFAVTS